uniref:Neuroserpin-like n=1 Tax=Petromyzon marinus TaxID=7757 RepID=A0AAJ7SMQ8_PETMA|nr:neuroserpin-like [Petromyzon marinus]
MLVALPGPHVELSGLEGHLTPELIAHWMESLRVQELQIHLPKFRVWHRVALREPLRAAGVSDVFNEGGLTGMADARDLKFTDAIHVAAIDVTEQGTHASAASGLVGAVKMSLGPPPRRLLVDRPFLFLILDTRSGASPL